jgi:hypothetical protein
MHARSSRAPHPGDRERANDLLRDALAVYRELGMKAPEHKLSRLLGDATVAQPRP